MRCKLSQLMLVALIVLFFACPAVADAPKIQQTSKVSAAVHLPVSWNVVQLTNSKYSENQPLISPDGKKIVYVMTIVEGFSDHKDALYAIDLSGAYPVRKLLGTFDGAIDIGGITLDNSKVTFGVEHYVENSWGIPGVDGGSIYLANLDGTGLTQLSDGGESYYPAISADGQWVAYLDEQCDNRLYQVRLSNMARYTMASNIYGDTYSKLSLRNDGSMLAYMITNVTWDKSNNEIYNKDLYVTDIFGNTRHLAANVGSPFMTRDGATAFYYSFDKNNYGLWSVGTDGSGKAKILDMYSDSKFAVSGDGQTIAYTKSVSNGNYSINLMSPDGSWQSLPLIMKSQNWGPNSLSLNDDGTRVAVGLDGDVYLCTYGSSGQSSGGGKPGVSFSLAGGALTLGADGVTLPASFRSFGAPFNTTLAFGSVQLPSGTAQVPLSLDTDKAIGSMDIVLKFDPAAVTVTDVKKGSLLGQGALLEKNIQPGTVRIGIVDPHGIQGSGSAAIVVLQIAGSGSFNGTLAIDQLTATDPQGNAIPSLALNGKLLRKAALKGDLNGDGHISSVDGLMALKMSVGGLPEDKNGDMNGDGKVAAADALEILRSSTAGAANARAGSAGTNIINPNLLGGLK